MAVEETPQGLQHAPYKGLWNDAVLYSAGNKAPIARSKKHLVPFGEYIPFREQLPFLEWVFAQSAGFSMNGDVIPGKSTSPMTLEVKGKKVQLTPLICFEDTVPKVASSYQTQKGGGANFLVNITNDGWFLQSEAADQHYQNARFRAIEQRSPLIRAGNTGRTAIVNIFGVEAANHPDSNIILPSKGSNVVPHESGTYSGVAYALEEPVETLYRRGGDIFCVSCTVLVLLWVVFQAVASGKISFGRSQKST